MRRLRLILRVSLWLERLSEHARLRSSPSVAQLQRYDEVRQPLDLETPYYPARGEAGYVLIPKDRYLAEVERLLSEAT